MNFKRATQEYLNVFYLIGFNNFKSNRTEIDLYRNKKLCKLLIVIVSRGVILIFFALQYADILDRVVQLFPIEPGGLYLANDELLTSVITFHATYFSGQFVKFVDKLYEIDFIMKKYFAKKIDFQSFRSKMFHKTILIFAPAIIFSCVFAIIRSAVHSTNFTISLIIIIYLKATILLHIIFHIELIHFIFDFTKDCLREKLKLLNVNFNYENRLIQSTHKFSIQNLCDECYVLKIIHYKVWELSLKFNKYFGWNLLLIILSEGLRLHGSVYGIFIVVLNYRGHYAVIRKY